MLTDEAIGRNVERIRRGRPRESVEGPMQQAGHQWYAGTLVRVERGLKSLTLTEADSLATVLGCQPRDFLQDEDLSLLEAAIWEVSDLRTRFEQLMDDYTMAVWNLVRLSDHATGLDPATRARVTDWIEQTPSQIVSDLFAESIAKARASDP